ncbi:hypothetical protein K7432_014442 [Basidiobolus ranarum]|uniref:AAA+ ATPase domain-containing protein n=1 Tax=Basidiobolus ranarum TaxID=34480 RepID=A0ABR2WHQ6_9FUNG
MLKVNPVVSKFEEEQPQPARKNVNRGRRVLSSDEEEFDPEKGYSSSEEFQTLGRLKKKKSLKSRSSGNFKITSKVILLGGEIGTCKTSAVYACAESAGYEVFEINPGMKRSGRDMLNLVGEMSQSHLVASRGWNSKSDILVPTEPNTKQSNTKQSLILIEEADILFEEDRNFWGSIVTLVEKSKRPVVITCNDFSRIPTWEVNLQAALHFSKPSIEELALYSNLVCLLEGYFANPSEIYQLCCLNNGDVRKTLQCLQFWSKSLVNTEPLSEVPSLESKKRDFENENVPLKRQKIDTSHFVSTPTSTPSNVFEFQQCDLSLYQMFGMTNNYEAFDDNCWSELIGQCEKISKFGKRQYWLSQNVIKLEIDSLLEHARSDDISTESQPLTDQEENKSSGLINSAESISRSSGLANFEENLSQLHALESMWEYSENLSFGATYLGLNESRSLQVLEPDVYTPSKDDNQGNPIIYKAPSAWDHLTTDDEIRRCHEVLSRLRVLAKTKDKIELDQFSTDRILRHLVFETPDTNEYSTSRALNLIVPLDLALAPTIYTNIKNEGVPYLRGYMKVISKLEQTGPPRGRTRAKARSRYLHLLDIQEGDRLIEDHLDIQRSSLIPASSEHHRFMDKVATVMNQFH